MVIAALGLGEINAPGRGTPGSGTLFPEWISGHKREVIRLEYAMIKSTQKGGGTHSCQATSIN